MTSQPRTGLAALAVALAVAGAGVAGYLTVLHLRGEAAICVGVHGCATVQNSRYSEMFGVPVALPGLALYAALAATALAWRSNSRGMRAELALAGFLATLAGLVVSGYFTYIEAFVLETWCSWCIASALLMTGLFAVWATLLAFTMRED